MDNQDKLKQKLKSVGLTEYEIKTYMALMDNSEAELTAEQIHQKTKIPTPRIYDTIENLSKLGLVKIISGRPKRFRVLPPMEGFTRFLEKKEQEINSEWENLKNRVYEITSFLGQIKINPEELLEGYSSLEEMELKTIEIIKNAKKDIRIFTNVFYWFDKIKEELEQVTTKGVKVRVIMTVADEKAKTIAEQLRRIDAKVRFIEKESVLVRGTIVDENQVVFVIWVSPKTGEKYIYRPHFSSNPGIIELFTNNFEYLWEKGK